VADVAMAKASEVEIAFLDFGNQIGWSFVHRTG